MTRFQDGPVAHRRRGPLPAAIVDPGEALYHELDASAERRVLPHGDLHHDNILAAQRQTWLAIGPKGVGVDPAFDVGPLLLNRWEDLYRTADPVGTLGARIDRLSAELGFPRSGCMIGESLAVS